MTGGLSSAETHYQLCGPLVWGPRALTERDKPSARSAHDSGLTWKMWILSSCQQLVQQGKPTSRSTTKLARFQGRVASRDDVHILRPTPGIVEHGASVRQEHPFVTTPERLRLTDRNVGWQSVDLKTAWLTWP